MDSERDEAEPRDDAEPATTDGPAADAARDIDEHDSPGASPDAPEGDEEAQPRTSEGSPMPEAARQEPAESEQPETVASPETSVAPTHDPDGRPLLVFVNEVAGGRKLLAAVREHAADRKSVV